MHSMKVDNANYTKGILRMTNAGEMQMPKTEFPENISLAMAYVPFQRWEQPYAEAIAFERGTMFPGLDFPFIGEEAVPNARKR